MLSLKAFSNTGVTESMTPEQAQKIILSNVFSLLLTVLVGLPFTIITYFLAEPLTFLPFIVTVGVMFCPFLNRMGMYMVSRILCSFLLLSVVPFYHALLIPGQSEQIVSVALLSLSFALIPFLLFSLKEWHVVLVNSLYSAFLLIAFDRLNIWLEMDLNDAFMRSGFFYHLTYVLAIVVAFACVLGLVFMHQKESANNKELIKAMIEQQDELKTSEEELKGHLDELKVAQQREEIRQWQSEGLAHFSAILRQELEMKLLCERLVSELCKYLNVNQSGLFIVDEKEKCLELFASYAYDRQKFAQRKIAFGQGLLGQAYLEKEYIYMTDIPDRYTFITSGLGDATPNTILIVPLLYNEEVSGIIEFASFKPFEQHQIDFILKVGEVLASSIHSMRTNEQTRMLLEEAQKNEEIVRAQEEELRQNMEELSATQENMQRKEQEYLQRIKELENQLVEKV